MKSGLEEARQLMVPWEPDALVYSPDKEDIEHQYWNDYIFELVDGLGKNRTI